MRAIQLVLAGTVVVGMVVGMVVGTVVGMVAKRYFVP